MTNQHLWEEDMNLASAVEGQEYIIKDIVTDDEELNAFLFSLGCYSGEPITVVQKLKRSCVVRSRMEDTTSTMSLQRRF